MADVFVSYRRVDEVAVGRLVKALRGEGLSVWWDRDIPPDAPWEATIEREHAAAKAVVVCWSTSAITSENVKAEARHAKGQNRLVQTFIEPCAPPMFFGERQGVDLSGWTGKSDDPRFRNVLEAVRAMLEGRPASVGVGLGVPGKRKVPVAAIAAAAVAVLAGGAAAWGMLGRREPEPRAAPATTTTAAAPLPNPQAVERAQLAPFEGVWGAESSCTPDNRYSYAVGWDAPSGLHRVTVSGARNYRSVGEVLSVRNGVVNTRNLSGDSSVGQSLELSLAQGALVINEPGEDASLRMIRCPAATGQG